jgi:hypothetical protein
MARGQLRAGSLENTKDSVVFSCTEDEEEFEDDEDGDDKLLEQAEEELHDAGMAIESARRYSELREQYDKTVQESESQSQDSQPSLVAGPSPPLPPLAPLLHLLFLFWRASSWTIMVTFLS